MFKFDYNCTVLVASLVTIVQYYQTLWSKLYSAIRQVGSIVQYYQTVRLQLYNAISLVKLYSNISLVTIVQYYQTVWLQLYSAISLVTIVQ